jgi:chemotaxis protein histidine kinase CheA
MSFERRDCSRTQQRSFSRIALWQHATMNSGASTATKARWQEVLAQLTREFDDLLPQRLARAGELLRACEAGGGDDESLVELQRILHTLAGSAATFGRPALGDAAKALELHVPELRERRDAESLARARTLLDAVEAAARPA